MGGWMDAEDEEDEEDYGTGYNCGSRDHYIRNCPVVYQEPDCGSIFIVFLFGFFLGVSITYAAG